MTLINSYIIPTIYKICRKCSGFTYILVISKSYINYAIHCIKVFLTNIFVDFIQNKSCFEEIIPLDFFVNQNMKKFLALHV